MGPHCCLEADKRMILIKMALREMIYDCEELNSSTVTEVMIQGLEDSCSMKGTEFIRELRYYQLLRKHSEP
jgi:hypothetical protein